MKTKVHLFYQMRLFCLLFLVCGAAMPVLICSCECSRIRSKFSLPDTFLTIECGDFEDATVARLSLEHESVFVIRLKN